MKPLMSTVPTAETRMSANSPFLSAQPVAALVVGTAALVVSATVPAHAQDVRRYGPETEQSSSSAGGGTEDEGGARLYPGQPRPEPNSEPADQSGSDAPNGEGRGDAEEPGENGDTQESYRIRMHDPPASGSDERPDRSRRPADARSADEARATSERNDSSEDGESTRSAERAAGKRVRGHYRGVVPGRGTSPDQEGEDQRSDDAGTGPNELTWVGFRPRADRTRVFVQTVRPAEYTLDVDESRGRVRLDLPDAEFAARKFSRDIDASHFDRVVRGVRARTSGDGVEIQIDLRAGVEPEVDQKKSYLYVDFPRDSDSAETDAPDGDR